MKLNLIPETLRHRHERRRRVRGWGVVLVIAIGLLAVPVTLDWSRKARAKRLRQEQADLVEVRSSMLAEWSTVREEVEETRAQIMRAEALRSKRGWSRLLALVAGAVPDRAWLTAVATDPPQPTGGAPERARVQAARSEPATERENVTVEAPRKLELHGFAPNAGDPIRFVQALKAADVFREVRLQRSSFTKVDDASFFRFNIVCEW